jgi:hypothetical protein
MLPKKRRYRLSMPHKSFQIAFGLPGKRYPSKWSSQQLKSGRKDKANTNWIQNSSSNRHHTYYRLTLPWRKIYLIIISGVNNLQLFFEVPDAHVEQEPDPADE